VGKWQLNSTALLALSLGSVKSFTFLLFFFGFPRKAEKLTGASHLYKSRRPHPNLAGV
jgi:hypothetical protein